MLERRLTVDRTQRYSFPNDTYLQQTSTVLCDVILLYLNKKIIETEQTYGTVSTCRVQVHTDYNALKCL